MIDYLEQLLTQVIEVEDEEEEGEPTSLFSALSPRSPSLSTATLSPSEELSVEQQGKSSSQKDNSSTDSLLTWLEKFDAYDKQIGFLQGQGKGKSLTEDIQSTGILSPSTQDSNEMMERATQDGALSLYRQLTDAQWQASGLVGGGNIAATPSFSTTSPIPSATSPSPLSTPSSPLSHMTPQSFDTLVTRDARRYDGGFILY